MCCVSHFKYTSYSMSLGRLHNALLGEGEGAFAYLSQYLGIMEHLQEEVSMDETSSRYVL